MDIPEGLKPILPFLMRSKETIKIAPLVSYFCKFYAIQKGIGMKSDQPEETNFVVAQLQELEEMKASIEIPTDEAESKQMVKAFAVRIFDKASRIDEQGMATASTAKTYHAASHFLEVMKVFGDLDEKEEGILKYAKYRAVYITKCLKEGTVPEPSQPKGGNQNDEEDDDLMKELASLTMENTTPSASTTTTTTTSTTSTTTPSNDEPEPLIDPFTGEPYPDSTTETKTVPNDVVADDDEDDKTEEDELADLMSAMGGLPKPSAVTDNDSASSTPSTTINSTNPYSNILQTPPSLSNTTPTPSVPEPEPQPQPQHVHEPEPAVPINAVPVSSNSSNNNSNSNSNSGSNDDIVALLRKLKATDLPLTTDMDKQQQAQKFSKWVTSSLQFSDTKAAVDNLIKTLNLLIEE